MWKKKREKKREISYFTKLIYPRTVYKTIQKLKRVLYIVLRVSSFFTIDISQ